MDVRGAEGEAVVEQRRVDHDSGLGAVQQVAQVAHVPVTAAHAVPRTVLIQHEQLARRKPALHTNSVMPALREGWENVLFELGSEGVNRR